MDSMDNGAVVIDGLAVHVDQERMSDWKTFSILRKVSGSENQYDQVDALLEIIGHATDQTEESIVRHLGGETARAEDVIALCVKIIQAVSPKN